MSILRIGEGQSWDQFLVAGYEAILDMGVHQVAGSLQLLASKVRPVLQQVPHPLRVNFVGPFGSEQVWHGKLHKQVAERRRIENAGVVKDGETTHDQ